MTMLILPLLYFTSMRLLDANAYTTFEGYRYKKPAVSFEFPKILPKNADIKPTTPKVATENISILIKQNSATEAQTPTNVARTMAAATAFLALQLQQQQRFEDHSQSKKSHKIGKIEKSTMLNPLAIRETNLNMKSNKNPPTATKETTGIVLKTKTNKFSLNQLPKTNRNSNSSTITSSTIGTHTATAGCYVYEHRNQQEQQHPKTKTQFNYKVNPANVASLEESLENKLNSENGYIYRISSNVNTKPNFDEPPSYSQHDFGHHTNRLKLKNKVFINTVLPTKSIRYCCDQSIDSLKVKFEELAINRPLERRLAPYTETLADKAYIE